MRKLVLSAYAFILLNSSTASAVTLQEALTSGYNNHEDLKIIRTDFLTEIEQFPRAVADFMPKVYATGNITDTKTSRKHASDPATRDIISTDNSKYSRTLTLEQPIFNGGSSVAGLKAAQSAFRASRDDYYSKEQQVFTDEIEVYLNCVSALEKYNISKISVKSNKTQLAAMREKFRLGESTETEVAGAESGLATAEANQAFAYANFEAAKANFTKVFALEAVGIKMPEIADNLPATLEEFIAIAECTNPAISSAGHKTKSAKASEYAAKAALLPRVSFRVDSGDTTYNPEDIDRNNVNTNSTTSTLSVVVPILEKGGVEYSDVRKAKYQTRKSVVNLDSQFKQIKANCKATWEAFQAAKTRVSATTQGVKSAEVAYQGTLQEEMLGSKTIVDVLTFEERLNNARDARVDAEKELVLASYRIKALTGELTAEKMHLPVEYFNPDKEFKKIKLRIVGF
jgi:outer membrane protein